VTLPARITGFSMAGKKRLVAPLAVAAAIGFAANDHLPDLSPVAPIEQMETIAVAPVVAPVKVVRFEELRHNVDQSVVDGLDFSPDITNGDLVNYVTKLRLQIDADKDLKARAVERIKFLELALVTPSALDSYQARKRAKTLEQNR
jgi:hypothetical protein